jgi:hypothetical protein
MPLQRVAMILIRVARRTREGILAYQDVRDDPHCQAGKSAQRGAEANNTAIRCIYRSARKVISANFALTEFSEVRKPDRLDGTICRQPMGEYYRGRALAGYREACMVQRFDHGGVLRVRDGGEQRVTPLELFFDLVYVFAITQLSHLRSLAW